MMPMESAGLLGALGGIAELAKDAMQRQPSSLPPGSPGSAHTCREYGSHELLPQHMAWWHWMVLAVVLAAAETLLPGAVAIWFAAAAAFIGLLLIVVPIPWQWQLIGFRARRRHDDLYLNYRKKHPDNDEQPNLNLRGQQYVGASSCSASRYLAELWMGYETASAIAVS